MLFACWRSEWINEVCIDGNQLRFRMLVAHRIAHIVFETSPHIDQDQILAGFKLVVETSQLLVLAVDAEQAAFPSTEQRRYANQNDVDIHRHSDCRPEWLEVGKQADTD